MKDFDINKIGKKMPYSAPSEDFFEKFSADVLSQVENKRKRHINFTRIISLSSAIAAIFVVGLIFNLNYSDKIITPSTNNIAFDNINESIDSYLSELSDSELSTLVSDMAYENDFYTYLLTE